MPTIQFEVSEKLDELMHEAGLDDRVELLNSALSLFLWSIRMRKLKYTVVAVDMRDAGGIGVHNGYARVMGTPLMDRLAANKII